MQEMKNIFAEYPGLQKMKVSDKFPYQERPQYGLVVKNISGSPMPLAADNFIGTVVSHCFTAKLRGKRGLLLDWVKENANQVTIYTEEDLSAQVAGSREFTLQYQPTKGNQNVELAKQGDPCVELLINGRPMRVPLGYEDKKILIPSSVSNGATVIAKYYRRGLVRAGLYYVEVIDVQRGSASVMVDSLLDFEGEIIKESTGFEPTFNLPHFPVHQNTFILTENDNFRMVEGLHYTLDYQTGVLTFLPNPDNEPSSTPQKTLRSKSRYKVEYRYQGESFGPFTIKPRTSYDDIIPGVCLVFSSWLEAGDKQAVIVTEQREPVSQEYGGHFDVNLNLDIYSRDPIQRELISDLLAIKVFGEIKPSFDSQGLTIVTLSLNGESEDLYDENTDTVYYMAGMDITFNTDWRLYAPLIPKIKTFYTDVEIVQSLNDFKVQFEKREGLI
jgi:hypothetical protein